MIFLNSRFSYKNKRVLILGSKSFIAQNIINKCSFKKIIKISKLQINSHNIKKRYLEKIIKKNKINIILNFMANNDNSNEIETNNFSIFYDNCLTLLFLLESIKKNKKIRVVNFSSTEIYKKKNSMYKISKLINILIIKFYKNFFKMNLDNLVLPNIYGPYDQNFKRIIPLLSKSLILNKTFKIADNRKKLKFIYVDDLILFIFKKIKPKIIKFRLREILLILKKIKDLYQKQDYVFQLSKIKNQNSKYFNLYKTYEWYYRNIKK